MCDIFLLLIKALTKCSIQQITIHTSNPNIKPFFLFCLDQFFTIEFTQLLHSRWEAIFTFYIQLRVKISSKHGRRKWSQFSRTKWRFIINTSKRRFNIFVCYDTIFASLWSFFIIQFFFFLKVWSVSINLQTFCNNLLFCHVLGFENELFYSCLLFWILLRFTPTL